MGGGRWRVWWEGGLGSPEGKPRGQSREEEEEGRIRAGGPSPHQQSPRTKGIMLLVLPFDLLTSFLTGGRSACKGSGNGGTPLTKGSY